MVISQDPSLYSFWVIEKSTSWTSGRKTCWIHQPTISKSYGKHTGSNISLLAEAHGVIRCSSGGPGAFSTLPKGSQHIGSMTSSANGAGVWGRGRVCLAGFTGNHRWTPGIWDSPQWQNHGGMCRVSRYRYPLSLWHRGVEWPIVAPIIACNGLRVSTLQSLWPQPETSSRETLPGPGRHLPLLIAWPKIVGCDGWPWKRMLTAKRNQMQVAGINGL